MKKKISIFLLILVTALIIYLNRSRNIDLTCSTILVQKKDNLNEKDLFSITLTIILYKNGQGLIHAYGEAYDNEKSFKVNRSVVLDYVKLEESTYEMTMKSVIKPSLDNVPEELNVQYFKGLSSGSVRIITFSKLDDNVIASISSGAYFICVTP
ncbi:hypothetical protein [Winslowiella toletana]|uniref:hypothetical protein n=1 Tax=Winslowiella toletana TaxID=92490 RepID=UPI0028BF1300|nr:hypothetical protein [Winslowiella toletana]WNN45704.1 hypothetical protein RIN69_07520 [Winslowiella toletana]